MLSNRKRIIPKPCKLSTTPWRKSSESKALIGMKNSLNCKNLNLWGSKLKSLLRMDTSKKPTKFTYKTLRVCNSIYFLYGETGWSCASRPTKKQRKYHGPRLPSPCSLTLYDTSARKPASYSLQSLTCADNYPIKTQWWKPYKVSFNQSPTRT